jgi:hypothetical protein
VTAEGSYGSIVWRYTELQHPAEQQRCSYPQERYLQANLRQVQLVLLLHSLADGQQQQQLT